jgi:signal transduction histidine kinase
MATVTWSSAEWLAKHRQRLLAAWAARLPEGRWGAELLDRVVRGFEALVTDGTPAALEAVADELVQVHLERNAAADAAVDLLVRLKATVYAALPADQALEARRVLGPAFDTSLGVVARAVDGASRRLLQERLDATDILNQRLAQSTVETDQALLRLRTLFDISRAINLTQGDDLGPTLDLAAETLSSLSQVDRCSIWLAENHSDVLTARAVQGLEAAGLRGMVCDPQRPVEGHGGLPELVARAFTSLKPQMISRRGDMPSIVLTVPLMDEYRVLGVIGVEGLGTRRGLTVALADLTQSVAEQLSTAVRNSQLVAEIVALNQELEQRVRERTRELSRVSRKLADLDRKKSDFIAIAGHELKTPLTLIRGYAEMIEQMGPGLPREEMWKAAIEGILRGTSRLDAILNDILAVAQIDNDVLWLSLAPVSVHKVVELACNEMQAGAEERAIRLELGDFRDLPRIHADGTRLHQVFVNLLSNAIKYTPNGGWVAVDGRLQPGDDGEPIAVEVVVADSGVGIDPEDQGRIFDKFYRVQDSTRHTTSKTGFLGGGPGLGLTIARGVIEAHGGRVWVESPRHDPERCPGSRFYVILPLEGPSRPD